MGERVIQLTQEGKERGVGKARRQTVPKLVPTNLGGLEAGKMISNMSWYVLVDQGDGVLDGQVDKVGSCVFRSDPCSMWITD